MVELLDASIHTRVVLHSNVIPQDLMWRNLRERNARTFVGIELPLVE